MSGKKVSQVLLILALAALLGGCSTVKGWFSKKKTDKPLTSWLKKASNN